MKYIIFLLLFQLVTFSQNNFEKLNEKAKKVILKYQKSEDLPGVSVSISYNDTLIFSEGFGYADYENKLPVLPSKTQFDIGSCTKMFTTVTLAKLVELDSIRLEDSVYKHLKDLSKKKYDFSIENLASHLSGLPRDSKFETWENERKVSKNNFHDLFKKEILMYKPGTKYLYSNLGFKVLGLVIEKKTRLDIGKANLKYIFNPLKMNYTQKDSLGIKGEFIAKFYPYERRNYTSFEGISCEFTYAEGCYLSTSEDLVKFGNALLFQNRLLKKESLQMLLKPKKTLDGINTNYGLGFESKKDINGNYYFGHEGNWVGSRSYMYVYPKSRLVIVLLANRMMHSKKYKHLNIVPEIAKIYNQNLN